MKIIDKTTWKRSEYFDFFSGFDEPFHGLATELDCTKAFHFCKKNNYSFFAFYLHKSVSAANAIEEFRYRIVEDEIVLYSEIHAGATIARSDGSFSFSFTPFHPDFEQFDKNLQTEITKIQQTEGLGLTSQNARPDAVHHSALLWHRFTSVSHARHFKYQDSVPKIAFGKIFSRNDTLFLPVSIHVHHGFADGLHVAHYLQHFQELLDAV